MDSARRMRRVRLAVAVAVVASLPPFVGPGRHAEAKTGTLVTTEDPYAGCTTRFAAGTKFAFEPAYEAEPKLAVNPANRDNMIAVWIQDRGLAGGKANAAAYTFDGGRTWRPVRIPGLSVCQGSISKADGQSDPWVAFSADGEVAYVSSTNGFHVDSVPTGTITVSTSTNGGRTWSNPVLVSGPAAPFVGPPDFNDRHAVVVNPLPGQATTAYITWFRITWTGLIFELMISKTENGGVAWSNPTKITSPHPFPHVVPTAELSVLPNGHLVVVYFIVRLDENFQPHEGKFFSRVSIDDGQTWSEAYPLTGSVTDFSETYPADPERSGFTIRAPAGIQTQVVDPAGMLHVAWLNLAPANQTSIVMTSSSDGRNWTPTRTIVPARPNTLTFTPMLASNASAGTLGLTVYDTRKDQPGDSPLTTDLWLHQSRDGGGTWTERHVAGSFDLRHALAGSSDFYFLGDYIGLVPDRRGYSVAYTLATPLAAEGDTDVFFERIPG